MLGAIIGDIVGSRYEFCNIKTKDFNLFDNKCRFTDDTVMTVAVLKTLQQCGRDTSLVKLKETLIKNMRDFGRRYPHFYGSQFRNWLKSYNPTPYNSCGNGAGMRISPVGFFAKNEFEVKIYSRAVTEITHNHPEGIIGAEAIAYAIFLARCGKTKEQIREKMIAYYPKIDLPYMNYQHLVEEYGWDYGQGSALCQDSVPQAIICFLESNGFEDAIKNAVSIGGDSDTIGAMVGGIAEAFYGIPEEIERKAKTYLPNEFLEILTKKW